MIKNIVYLDEQKMYSLSSQIFEGITEYVINDDVEVQSNSEEQKGPVGSGRLLGDILKISNRSIEKKFLHDYSYLLFEKQLLSKKAVLEINCREVTREKLTKDIDKYSFVKIKGVATFTDMKKLKDLINSFNDIGEALTRLTMVNEIENMANNKRSKIIEMNKGKKKANGLNEQLTNSAVINLAREKGLNNDPKFLNSLALLLDYGYADRFEIQQDAEDIIFTSCLKRECFRESEDLLISKYSRKTTKEFVIFGLVSQSFARNLPKVNEEEGFDCMKAAFRNIIEHMTNVELEISGKQSKEIVIDPIAVYYDI